MSRKTLIFHIGMPKTATTTIQGYFHKRRKVAGIEYCSAGGEDRHRNIWASIMYAMGERKPKILRYRFDSNSWKGLISELREEILASRNNAFFVSFEGFSTFVERPKARKYLAHMKKMLEPIDVVVMCYVRSPRDYLISKYKSEVSRQTSISRFIDWVVDSKSYVLNQASVVAFYESIFGADWIDVRSYDDAKRVGILNDFVSAVRGRSKVGLSPVRSLPQSVKADNRGLIDDEVERVRREQIPEDHRDRPGLIAGRDGYLEKEWVEFMNRLENANSENAKLFRRVGMNPDPITLPWMIDIERKLNFY